MKITNWILIIIITVILTPPNTGNLRATIFPELEIEKRLLDFGIESLNTENVLELEIKCVGYVRACIMGFKIKSDSLVFTVLNDISYNRPVYLEPGEKLKLMVMFRPDRIDIYNSKLHIVYDGPRDEAITLVGQGVKNKSRIKFSRQEIIFQNSTKNENEIQKLNINRVGYEPLEIIDISLEKDDGVFTISKNIDTPLEINDYGLSVFVEFLAKDNGYYKNNIIVNSSDYLLPKAVITIIAQIGDISSVSDFSESKEFTFQSNDDGYNIIFSIVSERVLEKGTFAFYSQEGKLIKTVNVSGNSSELQVSIDKSELPKLSFIRFTHGERVYTHKFVRE
jgi:hypothetical protein